MKSQKNDMKAHITAVIAKAAITLKKLKPITDVLDQKGRKEVITSKVLSILEYGIELYIGQPQDVKEKLDTAMRRCFSQIYQKPVYMMSRKKLCKHLKMETPDQRVKKSAMKFLRKVILTKKPAQLHNNFKFTKNTRTAASISLQTKYKTKKGRQNLIHQSVKYPPH